MYMCEYIYFCFRLIRFNKRFRALINAFGLVLPRIIDITVLLFLIYYFFAIIAMECFSGEVYQHCCKSVILIVY